jgi:hypothetical protein
MVLLEQVRVNLFLTGLWVKQHSIEIVLAALFALPFAYLIGAYFERPDPFVIYVVADSDTNEKTLDIFREKTKGNLARIGDVDVVVQLRQLPENTADAAQKMAEDLGSRPDTLMVIGSGRSQLAEKSLPTYFGMKPRVPYIATTASDDDLLKNCDDKCYEGGTLRSVWHKAKFAPLLQLSPTNKIQASSAIEFAVENGKHRFLIIVGNDTQNRSYADNLVSEYEEAIQGAAGEGASEVNKFEVSALPDDATLKGMNPECILYAGSFGEGQTVFNRFSRMQTGNKQMLMILSDSVIQTRGSDAGLSQGFKAQSNIVLPVRFTHQTFASDYNNHVSTYDRDAFAIAKTLIDDLNDRGVDLRMRMKSMLHIHSAKDARRNLNRVMKENSEVRTWYLGEARAGEYPITYIFKGHNQYNGIFHVWKLEGPEKSPGPKMDDVDHWHPGRGIAAAQESAWLASQQ